MCNIFIAFIFFMALSGLYYCLEALCKKCENDACGLMLNIPSREVNFASSLNYTVNIPWVLSPSTLQAFCYNSTLEIK